MPISMVGFCCSENSKALEGEKQQLFWIVLKHNYGERQVQLSTPLKSDIYLPKFCKYTTPLLCLHAQ